MKFLRALTLIYLIDVMIMFSVTLASNWNQLLQTYGNQQTRRQTNCRFPLFNCRLINRFRSTKRQTALQNQALNQANMALNGAYDQSLAYPSYAYPLPSDSSQIQSYYPNGGYLSNGQIYPMASESNDQNTAYGPQSTYNAQPYGQSPNTIDVHKVLDQFIRSAGLSPQGDHEAEAAHSNSFAKAGTSPVLVFKKLFSFPFYVSTDPNVVDIYGKNWK